MRAVMLDHVAGEVAGVALGLEAEEVEIRKAAREAMVLGQGGEDLGRREGDMVEEADPPAPAGISQFLAEEEEVVVMHPDPVAWPEQAVDEAAEAAVDLGIGLEGLVVETREIYAVMADRPQRAVGVAEVIALVFPFAQIREGVVDVALGDEADAAALAVVGFARPAEPEAAAAFGEGFPECDSKAAGRGLAGGGGAVGGDDEPSHMRRSSGQEAMKRRDGMPARFGGAMVDASPHERQGSRQEQ